MTTPAFTAPRFDRAAMAERSAKAPRIPLFYIDEPDGTEKAYEVQKDIEVGPLLGMLDDLANSGETAAVAKLLRRLIGDEGYDALINLKGMQKEDLVALMEAVKVWAFGQIEDLGETIAQSAGK